MAKKHVCITGATRGLGRSLVNGFLELGWQVSGCGRNPENVETLQNDYSDGHFAPCDVSNPEAVDAFARSIIDQTGCPDLLINNAAIINQPAPVWKAPRDDVDNIVDINIKGAIYVMQAFIPAMIERGSGVIANLSSGWGRSTSPDVALYCTTKWAIEGLSSATAQDLPSGVACAAVNPGIIDTEMLRDAFGDSASSYPSPTEWAKSAVPFFAGLDASCNGRQLTVPG